MNYLWRTLSCMFDDVHIYNIYMIQLGYVPINLSEFAGAGVVQRKYLLESYNEHKHKPDNSILRVKVMLRQISGDVLFKAYVSPFLLMKCKYVSL